MSETERREGERERERKFIAGAGCSSMRSNCLSFEIESLRKTQSNSEKKGKNGRERKKSLKKT